jgi:AcrR family transcriptional regulator
MNDTPVTTAPAADARTRILDAAEAIVQARGVPALTLEAAARDAGVSKGGLLYHFASKEALLAAMLGRLAEAISRDFDAVVAAQPEGRGRVARGLIAWAFEEMACEQQERAAAVFLAAFHHDRGLLDPVRAVFERIRAALAGDGLAPGVGTTIMTATDGMFMSRVFGMYELGPAELQAMRGVLEALLEGAP